MRGRILLLLAGLSFSTAAAARDDAAASGSPRLARLSVRIDPTFRVDDPRGVLATGFGGTLVDLHPIEDDRFHVSAGGRMFGRPGRAGAEPENRRLLSPPITAARMARRSRPAPAMLVGYGLVGDTRRAEAGLSVGLDAGLVMGPALPHGDRGARAPRLRGSGDRDGRAPNEVARLTMQYRF